jgi:crossover junction endonuclease EME1
MYHEISDEEDEDLKAAIAASLADMDTQPMYVAPRPRPSAFQDPTELWNSPPRAAATQVLAPTIRVPPRMSNAAARQPSPKFSEPPSGETSFRVRDDTRRLLSVLDDLTTNHLKRKNEETPSPPPPKKTSKTTKKPAATENLDDPKPKRGRLTQEEKVLPHPHKTNNPRTPAPQPKQKKPRSKNPNVSKKSPLLSVPHLY